MCLDVRRNAGSHALARNTIPQYLLTIPTKFQLTIQAIMDLVKFQVTTALIMVVQHQALVLGQDPAKQTVVMPLLQVLEKVAVQQQLTVEALLAKALVQEKVQLMVVMLQHQALEKVADQLQLMVVVHLVKVLAVDKDKLMVMAVHPHLVKVLALVQPTLMVAAHLVQAKVAVKVLPQVVMAVQPQHQVKAVAQQQLMEEIHLQVDKVLAQVKHPLMVAQQQHLALVVDQPQLMEEILKQVDQVQDRAPPQLVALQEEVLVEHLVTPIHNKPTAGLDT